MAQSAIKITRDQREAIYQAVRTHLVGLSDVFTLLERQDDVPGAERLARDFADDFRLLEDLGWHENGSSGQVELTMPHSKLSALMKRIREETEGGFHDAIRERDSVAPVEGLVATMRACDAVLVYTDAEQVAA
jgi:hypothetical protein